VTEANSSIFLAVIFGMFLVLLFLGIAFVIFRAVLRKPSRSAPLIPAEDGHFAVVGKRVSCSHCGGTTFTAKEILLNTWLLSLLRIDWLDSSANVLSCQQCGLLTWFAQDE
jgi:predicted nucleic-acid-binding Zn-ribbon protein